MNVPRGDACDTPIDRVCTAMPHLGVYRVEGLQNEVAHQCKKNRDIGAGSADR